MTLGLDGTPPADAGGPFVSSWRRKHLTVDERVARGQAARQEVCRHRCASRCVS